MKIAKPELDDLIDMIDLERIRVVMKALDWNWAGKEEVPTIMELIRAIDSLYASAYQNVVNQYEQGGRGCSVASGGFEVEVSLDKGVKKDNIIYPFVDLRFGFSACNRMDLDMIN